MDISIRNIAKTYGVSPALHGLDLDIRQGEILSLLGPSGCGKSTALRIIAGLGAASSGTIRWAEAGADHRRDVSFVFQEPTLMPWASVFDNVWLPLRLKGVGRGEARNCGRVEAAGQGDQEGPVPPHRREPVGPACIRRQGAWPRLVPGVDQDPRAVAGREGGLERFLVAVPLGRHDDHRRGTDIGGRNPVADRRVPPQCRGQIGEGAGHRRAADHHKARRGDYRLHEDLQRAFALARDGNDGDALGHRAAELLPAAE